MLGRSHLCGATFTLLCLLVTNHKGLSPRQFMRDLLVFHDTSHQDLLARSTGTRSRFINCTGKAGRGMNWRSQKSLKGTVVTQPSSIWKFSLTLPDLLIFLETAAADLLLNIILRLWQLGLVASCSCTICILLVCLLYHTYSINSALLSMFAFMTFQTLTLY